MSKAKLRKINLDDISKKKLEESGARLFREQMDAFNNSLYGQIRIFEQNQENYLKNIINKITEPQATLKRRLNDASPFKKLENDLEQINCIAGIGSKLNSTGWNNSLSSVMKSIVDQWKIIDFKSSLSVSSFHQNSSIGRSAKQWQRYYEQKSKFSPLLKLLTQYDGVGVDQYLSSIDASKKLKGDFEKLRCKLPDGLCGSQQVSAKKFETLINDVESHTNDLSSISEGQCRAAYAAASAYLNSNSGASDLQTKMATLSPGTRLLINVIIQCVIIPLIAFYVLEFRRDIAVKNSSIPACEYASLRQGMGINTPVAEITNPNGARVYPDATDDVAPVYKFEHKEFVALMWDRTPDSQWRRVAYAFNTENNAPIKFGWIRTNTYERIRMPRKNLVGLYSEMFEE